MRIESSVSLDCKFLRHHHCPRRKILRRRIKKLTKDLSPTPLDCSRLYAVVIPVIISINLYLKKNISFFAMIVLMSMPFFFTYPSKGIINKVSLGDLSSGRAFDNGCTCFYSCQGVVNDLRGQKTDCFCNVSYCFVKQNSSCYT